MDLVIKLIQLIPCDPSTSSESNQSTATVGNIDVDILIKLIGSLQDYRKNNPSDKIDTCIISLQYNLDTKSGENIILYCKIYVDLSKVKRHSR